MSILSKKKFDEYKIKLHEEMLKKKFISYDWTLASEGDVVYYKKTAKKLIVILCSNDSEYVSKTITIIVDDGRYLLTDDTLNHYISDLLANMSSHISTNNLGLLHMLCEYNFDFDVGGD